MDHDRFGALTRKMAAGRSRRSVLKGLLGVGGAAVMATVNSERAEAAWSTLVCLPDGQGDYLQRLIPTAAVPLYVSRYGALLAKNGICHCVPLDPGVGCANARSGGRDEYRVDGVCTAGTASLPCISPGELACAPLGDCSDGLYCLLL